MPTWIILAAVLLVLYLVFWRDSGSDSAEPELPEPLEVRDWTPTQLQKYNGKDDPRVLVGINGKVFDVTAGKMHYGMEGPYAAFAGRDASRGLAKHSFELDMLTPVDLPLDTLSDITDEERGALIQWAEFFEAKYPYCGRLVNP